MRTALSLRLALLVTLGALGCASNTDGGGIDTNSEAGGNSSGLGSGGSNKRGGQENTSSSAASGGGGGKSTGRGGASGGSSEAGGNKSPTSGKGGSSSPAGTGGATAGTGGKTAGAGGAKTSEPDGGKGTGGGAGNSTGGADGGASDGGKSSGTGGTQGGADGGGTASQTIPGNGCTPPAAYGNLFASVLGKTQAEIDEKFNAAWGQLFNPSGSDTIYYNGPGTDESYVEDVNNKDVRTEGMSYGMMIAVQSGHQTEFDRLWAWVRNHMATGTSDTSQIGWQAQTSGSRMSSGGAPDGEEYFATALIFAAKRWGSTGKFDYAKEAEWVLHMLKKQYFNDSAHMVKFVANQDHTDGSYVLPAFYQVWACFDTTNASYWNAAVSAGRTFFHNAIDSNGVIGDQSQFTGATVVAAGPDTIRCVANIMMDHNFFSADTWQTETYAPKYSAYVSTTDQNSLAATACNGLLGFGLPAESGKAFVEKVWSTSIPTGQYRYYDGVWYMMSMLHLSGQFRLWY